MGGTLKSFAPFLDPVGTLLHGGRSESKTPAPAPAPKPAKVPEPEPVVPMPDPEDTLLKQRKRRAAAQDLQGGRQSTIFSDSRETLG